MTNKIFGTSIKRVEDPAMLRGEAKFIADISFPDMLHMAILRSSQGHARIRHIDTSLAEKMPGVVRIITSADLDNKLMPLPCIWIPGGVESHFPSHPMGVPGAGYVLAKDKVRYIGDPVAVVVAETRYQAHDALEKIKVDYEALPVITDAEFALRPDAPQLHDEVPSNLNAYCPYGNKEGTEKAIAEAEVVVDLHILNQRTINSPIEPRGAIGQYSAATGDYTLYATTQSPHNHRLLLALMVLGIPFNKLRVVAPEIGGSFGTKGYLYADMALVLFLAKELGRPVKWVDSRSGMMRSTVQGRDQKQYGTLAGTKDGKITALRCTGYANLGAYPSTIGPGVATAMVGRSITSVYEIPNAFCEIYAVFTNTVSLGAQRGSGRAEATFLTERLIDLYAAKIGMDPAEVRRINLVPPDKFPYDNGLGWKYDSGNYPAVLEKALEMIEYHNLAKRREDARKRGKRLGVGLGCFVAISGVGPSPRMAKEGMLGGTWESARVTVHPTGEVTVVIGSKPHGQSHETTFAQVAAEELGVEMSKIQVLHSDTARAPYGQGSYGSRSFSVGGAAVDVACREVRKKAIKAAAHIFHVMEEDVKFTDGRLYVENAPEKSKTLQEVALELWYGWNLPAGMEPNLEIETFFDPPDFNYPFGAHAALVEIDELTGQIELVRYVAVNDVGNVANPLVIEGQIQGGITHGIGQVLMEQAIYSEEGQLVTNSFAEYAIPKASQLLNYELARTVTPSPHNTLGAKGAGEVGTIAPAAAIANAICNALADLGIEHIDMPITSEKVWRALHATKSADAGQKTAHQEAVVAQ